VLFCYKKERKKSDLSALFLPDVSKKELKQIGSLLVCFLSFFLSVYLSFFLPFVGLFFNVKQIIRKNQNCFLGQTSLALKKVFALDRKKQLQKSVTTALKIVLQMRRKDKVKQVK
jgi:hypothetical protein